MTLSLKKVKYYFDDNNPQSVLHFSIFHSPLNLPRNSVDRGVRFQLRRASYREKGKSGATFKILSYFPNTDERWSKGPAMTDAKRRQRQTSLLPQAPGPGVPTACSSQGRLRPRCHHLLPP